MISQRSPLAAELLAAATACQLQFVLHLNLRDIRISTRLKVRVICTVPVESLLEDMYISYRYRSYSVR